MNMKKSMQELSCMLTPVHASAILLRSPDTDVLVLAVHVCALPGLGPSSDPKVVL